MMGSRVIQFSNIWTQYIYFVKTAITLGFGLGVNH